MIRERTRRAGRLLAALLLAAGLTLPAVAAAADDSPEPPSTGERPPPDAAPVPGTEASDSGDPGETGSDETDGAPAAPEPPPLDDSLSTFRTPFPVLAKRTIGTTSRAVEYDWRRGRVQVAASADHLFELNNFNSLRAGGLVRFPSDGLIYELGLSHVFVWDTPSSQLLALTPYRQPGRPQRVELDFAIGVPLAEGVVTTRPRWLPAVEMVFSAYAGFRYLWYPGSLEGSRFGETVTGLLSPSLRRIERENLQQRRLDAMRVDPARYGLLVGFGNDVYLRQGVFVSPRVMLALPLLAPATATELLWWGDARIALGVAL